MKIVASGLKTYLQQLQSEKRGNNFCTEENKEGLKELEYTMK